MPVSIAELKVKVFADGADKPTMLRLAEEPWIRGFTTNPTLMRKAGVTDYEAFARDILRHLPDRPISFEIFADEFDEMERQACRIAEWGENVFVKIPITNTRREPSLDLICRLANRGIRINVTAVFTMEQVRTAAAALQSSPAAYLSVFAGRIADTGRDPLPVIAASLELIRPYPNIELIWASPREVLNVIQADSIGCHIITATSDILNKLGCLGKNLADYSLETVAMFYEDAAKSHFCL
jgi:transaldolase